MFSLTRATKAYIAGKAPSVQAHRRGFRISWWAPSSASRDIPLCTEGTETPQEQVMRDGALRRRDLRPIGEISATCSLRRRRVAWRLPPNSLLSFPGAFRFHPSVKLLKADDRTTVYSMHQQAFAFRGSDFKGDLGPVELLDHDFHLNQSPLGRGCNVLHIYCRTNGALSLVEKRQEQLMAGFFQKPDQSRRCHYVQPWIAELVGRMSPLRPDRSRKRRAYPNRLHGVPCDRCKRSKHSR